MSAILREYISFERFMIFTALILLSSIGLHMIIAHHEHPDFMGEKIEAAFHGENKKWLLVALAIVSVIVGQGFAETFLRKTVKILNYFSLNHESGSPHWHSYNFLLAYFRTGLLHPKTW